eukprot:scaffold2715_cov137-Skeletonema_dohrnii-CCMP3373.AAC.4
MALHLLCGRFVCKKSDCANYFPPITDEKESSMEKHIRNNETWLESMKASERTQDIISTMPSDNDPTTTKSDQAAAAAGDSPAAANKGAESKPPRRREKRSSNKHKKNRSRSRNDENPKRHGGRKPLRRPIIIPEARVVQAPTECSFISDHEDEEEEREIQESIRRHVRVFSYSRNPEFFNLVYHSNDGNGSSDNEGDNGYLI